MHELVIAPLDVHLIVGMAIIVPGAFRSFTSLAMSRLSHRCSLVASGGGAKNSLSTVGKAMSIRIFDAQTIRGHSMAFITI